MIGKSAHLRGFRPFLLSQNTLFIHITSIVCFNYVGFSEKVTQIQEKLLREIQKESSLFCRSTILKNQRFRSKTLSDNTKHAHVLKFRF